MKNDKNEETNIRKSIQTARPIGRIIPQARRVISDMNITRSKAIAHFAPNHSLKSPSTTQPLATKTAYNKKILDIGPVKHPLVAKIEKAHLEQKKLTAVKPNLEKTSKIIKEEAITEAFSKITPTPKEKKVISKTHSKLIRIFSVILAILVVIGFCTYVFLPNISMTIANARAGIDASYPEYHPDGYSVEGALSYGDGEVTINYHSNTGDKKFSIKQSRSSWDSTAVKAQVNKDSNGNFDTFQESGLTIFSYNNNHNATWVNDSILYSISGDAPLSREQIRHIATSL